MKFPSFSVAINGFFDALRRFPIAALASFLVATLMIWMNHLDFDIVSTERVMPVVLAACFVFPLALAVEVLSEERKWKVGHTAIARIVLLALGCFSYAYYFKDYVAWGSAEWLRFILTEGAAVCLFLGLPFLYKGKDASKSFWVYSLDVFASFLKAFAFFGLLFLGVVLLILSFDYLFDANVDEKIYLDVWLVITGILGVPFFMSGIPENVSKLARSNMSEGPLRVFSKYFLVPLVFLYVLLLYAYSGKIAIEMQWPLGGVAGWIIGFSTIGIVTYFFVSFLQEKYKSYLSYFRAGYFWALLPLIVVLFLAVWVRVADYGVTEVRYFGIAFAVWMALLSFYYIFSKAKDLRFLPFSLAVVLLFSAWAGPFSAFGFSLNNQMSRLETLLTENNLLVDGKIVKMDGELASSESGRKIDNILRYIVSTHGVDALDPWFEADLKKIADENDYYWSTYEDIRSLMGFGDYYDGNYNYHNVVVYSSPDFCSQCVLDVSGYDNAFMLSDSYPSSIGNWEFDWDWNDGIFDLSYLGDSLLSVNMMDELRPYVSYESSANLYGEFNYPFSNDRVEGELRVIELHGYGALEGERIDNVWFSAFVVYNEK